MNFPYTKALAANEESVPQSSSINIHDVIIIIIIIIIITSALIIN